MVFYRLRIVVSAVVSSSRQIDWRACDQIRLNQKNKHEASLMRLLTRTAISLKSRAAILLDENSHSDGLCIVAIRELSEARFRRTTSINHRLAGSFFIEWNHVARSVMSASDGGLAMMFIISFERLPLRRLFNCAIV